ncbi:MAG: hypothetical protein IBX69_15525 [Anaerolineales bacterium]|nr:hypothetical protein [Anaerolineales bacterium]
MEHRRRVVEVGMVASKKHGQESASFGQWLSDRLRENPRYRHYAVYYDHGDKTIHPNVAAIKGIYGDKVTSSSQLTQVDVMVAKPSGEIIALVEIEERPSSPKKLIGDVFTNLMCSRYAVRVNGEQRYFNITPETILILAGIMNPKGNKFKKLERVIKPRISDFSSPKDAVGLDQVRFLFRDTIEEVIDELKVYFGRLIND